MDDSVALEKASDELELFTGRVIDEALFAEIEVALTAVSGRLCSCGRFNNPIAETDRGVLRADVSLSNIWFTLRLEAGTAFVRSARA